MYPIKSYVKHLIIFSSFLLLSSCANHNPEIVKRDPLEPYNRAMFGLNQVFDKVVGRPTANIYTHLTPTPLQKGIRNGFNNLALIPTVANDLLQLQIDIAGRDFSRFLVNSTLGIAGIIDVAQYAGLPEHYNDMGMTFRYWGSRSTPYLVLPLLGPSTVADATGYLFDYTAFSIYPYINPVGLRYGLLALNYVQRRAALLDADLLMRSAAVDLYTFQRDAYLQYRESAFQKEYPNRNNRKGINDNIDDFIIEEEQSESVTNPPHHSPKAKKQTHASPSSTSKKLPKPASSPPTRLSLAPPYQPPRLRIPPAVQMPTPPPRITTMPRKPVQMPTPPPRITTTPRQPVQMPYQPPQFQIQNQYRNQ